MNQIKYDFEKNVIFSPVYFEKQTTTPCLIPDPAFPLVKAILINDHNMKDKIFLFVSALTVVVIEYKIKDTYKGFRFPDVESHFYFYQYP